MPNIAIWCCCGSACLRDGTECSNCGDGLGGNTNAEMTVQLASITPCGCNDPDITGCTGNSDEYDWNVNINGTHTLTQDGDDPCLFTKTVANALQYTMHLFDAACGDPTPLTENIDVHIHLLKAGSTTAKLIVFAHTTALVGTGLEAYMLLFYNEITTADTACDGEWSFTNDVTACNADGDAIDGGYVDDWTGNDADYQNTAATGGTGSAECATS